MANSLLPRPTREPRLGETVECSITGYRGTVTGFVRYISGCNQALVQPRATEAGKMPDSAWIDVQRLLIDETVGTVMLDNGPTPGADRAAPKR